MAAWKVQCLFLLTVHAGHWAQVEVSARAREHFFKCDASERARGSLPFFPLTKGCFPSLETFFASCSDRLNAGSLRDGQSLDGALDPALSRCCEGTAALLRDFLRTLVASGDEVALPCLKALVLLLVPWDIRVWSLYALGLLNEVATFRRTELVEVASDVYVSKLHRAVRTAEMVAMGILGQGLDDAEANDVWMQSLGEAWQREAGHLASLLFEESPYGQKLRRHGVDLQGDEVVLVILVVGQYSRAAWTTLGSILAHRSCRVRVVVLGDSDGLAGFQASAALLASSQGSMLQGLRFEYLAIFEHTSFQSFMARMPKRCSQSAYGKPGLGLFSLLILHELLPEDISHAIVVDAGDVIVFGDIQDLWQVFDSWPQEGTLGLPVNMGYQHLQKAVWKEFGYLNAGVQLHNLANMRQYNFTEAMLEAARQGVARARELGHDLFCNWEQDVFNTLLGSSPAWSLGRRFQLLPCEWMFLPSQSWDPNFNRPENWPAAMWEKRVFLGLYSVHRMLHVCPEEEDWTSIILLRQSRPLKGRMAYMAHLESTLKSVPFLLEWDDCPCGTDVKLVHFMAEFKSWPWAQRLLEAYDILEALAGERRPDDHTWFWNQDSLGKLGTEAAQHGQ